MIRLISTLIILITALTVNAQNYFDASNSKKFADYLFETKQYSMAADELERILFMLPEDQDVRLNLIKAYRLNNQSDKAILRLNSFHPNYDQMPLEFAKELLNNALIVEDFHLATKIIEKNTFEGDDDKNYKLSLLVLQKDWANAQNYFNANKPFSEDLNNIMTLQSQTRYKSPFIAGSLSAVVPGLGKVYTDRWTDGIFSLIFVGVNAWQSYNGFKKDGKKSVYGWIMGSIACSFYIGNIYGSAKSAKKYNQHIDDHFYEEARFSVYNNL